MSGEVTLAFLGEQIVKMQVDIRAIQGDIRRLDGEVGFIKQKLTLIEAEQVEIRDLVHLAVGEFTVRMSRMERRMDGMDARQDRFEAYVDAKFAQMAETAATNTQILLAAIQARPAPPN
jgi:hypothetical protein